MRQSQRKAGEPIVDFYLVRHGEAVSETFDPRRPLTRVGREEVERVARLAVGRKITVSSIFHSGILRAQQTAEIFAQALVPAVNVQHITGLLPQDDPAIAKAEMEVSEQPIMLVGHLPHMSRLASLLLHGNADREIVSFSPATVVCCSRNGSDWKIAWTLGPQSR
jgi:phosphohistidine phosphatase